MNNSEKEMPERIGYIALNSLNTDIVPSLSKGDRFARPDDNPPWIVIHKTPGDATPSRWPCRLWSVKAIRVLEPQRHTGTYLRCHEIEAIQPEPTASMFGTNGQTIVAVLDRLLRLDITQATALAENRDPDAAKLYDDVWRRWGGSDETEGCYERVLLAPGPNRSYGSPVGQAFSLVIATMDDRADVLTNGLYRKTDAEGEFYYVPLWREVSAALLETTLGFGAPDLMSEEEVELLLKSWNAAFPK